MQDTPLNELEMVVLTVDVPHEDLSAGDIGTVVKALDDGAAYEVEFAGPGGRAKAQVTVPRARLRRSTGEDG